MMTDDQILEVVQARKEGKRIQWKEACAPQLSWINLSRSTSGYQEWTWDFINCDYRVAPEPRKPREFWLISAAEPQSLSSNLFLAYPCCQRGVDCEQIHVREVIKEPFNADKIPESVYCP